MGPKLLLALANAALWQSTPPAAPTPIAPAAIGDEFNGTELSVGWQVFDARYGWPDKQKATDVG